MKKSKWVVKVNRVTPRLLWVCDNKEDATKQCAELNEKYQTNEYYVERYDPEKVREFFGLGS